MIGCESNARCNQNHRIRCEPHEHSEWWNIPLISIWEWSYCNLRLKLTVFIATPHSYMNRENKNREEEPRCTGKKIEHVYLKRTKLMACSLYRLCLFGFSSQFFYPSRPNCSFETWWSELWHVIIIALIFCAHLHKIRFRRFNKLNCNGHANGKFDFISWLQSATWLHDHLTYVYL